MFTGFYETSTYEEAKEILTTLIYDFSSCDIPELVAFSNTLKPWKREIINSFTIIDEEPKIKPTSAISENRNKVIKQLKHNSNCYKNWSIFRNRILYVSNSDATYSLNPKEVNSMRTYKCTYVDEMWTCHIADFEIESDCFIKYTFKARGSRLTAYISSSDTCN